MDTNELTEKINTGSGQSRVGDFAIAAAIMDISPWLGADLDKITTNMSARAASTKFRKIFR